MSGDFSREFGVDLAHRRVAELKRAERLRYQRVGVQTRERRVDDDRENELASLNPPRTIGRLTPFETEIALSPLLGRGREERHEYVATLDGADDLSMPIVAGLQYPLVEPDDVADFLQAVADALR